MENGASSYHRFLNGDDNGIIEIVNDYKDGLILYLTSFVDNIYTAEELTEETFFRLIVNKPKYYGKSSFKTWLYAIGRNIAIDFVRHASKVVDVAIEDLETYLGDNSDLERAYIKDETKIQVHKALAKLPRDYRQVLWLIYFEEMTNAEASAVMNKSDRQIRNLIYRAKQALKEELMKEGFEYEEF